MGWSAGAGDRGHVLSREGAELVPPGREGDPGGAGIAPWLWHLCRHDCDPEADLVLSHQDCLLPPSPPTRPVQ